MKSDNLYIILMILSMYVVYSYVHIIYSCKHRVIYFRLPNLILVLSILIELINLCIFYIKRATGLSVVLQTVLKN